MILNEYNELFSENFDLYDQPTRKCIIALEDAEQDQLLTALASALYDKVVEKADKIDFGTIPTSRGDITKVEGFNNTEECLKIMRTLVNEYKEDPFVIDTVITAVENIKSRKAKFMKAYSLNIELPMLTYNLITLAIEQSVSFLISVCIQYIKDPTSENITAALDKVAYNNSRDNLLYQNLDVFNQSCASGEMDIAIDNALKTGGKIAECGDECLDYDQACANKPAESPFELFGDGNDAPCAGADVTHDEGEPVNGSVASVTLFNKQVNADPTPTDPNVDLTPASTDSQVQPVPADEPVQEGILTTFAALSTVEKIAAGLGLAATGAGGVALGLKGIKFLLQCFIPMLRSITYFLINVRVKMSDGLAIQAQFVEANAYKLQYSTTSNLDDNKKDKVVKKQLKIAEKLKWFANKIAIDHKKAEKDALKAATDENKKIKVEDIKDNLSADIYSKSVLF